MAEAVFSTIIRGELPSYAIASWGGRRLSLGGEVTVTGVTGGRRRRAFMLLTLRRVMAGETIRLFKFYRADVADGARAAAMLWRWRHASESGVFNIGTGTGHSFRDLMLALGAACGRVPVIASVDRPEAMRPNATIHLSPRRPAVGCALGDHAPFMPIEEAVRDFVTHHLSPPDP